MSLTPEQLIDNQQQWDLLLAGLNLIGLAPETLVVNNGYPFDVEWRVGGHQVTARVHRDGRVTAGLVSKDIGHADWAKAMAFVIDVQQAFKVT